MQDDEQNDDMYWDAYFQDIYENEIEDFLNE